jgi:hypothetical protein
MSIREPRYITKMFGFIYSIIFTLASLATAVSNKPEPLVAAVITGVLIFGILTCFRVLDKEWP